MGQFSADLQSCRTDQRRLPHRPQARQSRFFITSGMSSRLLYNIRQLVGTRTDSRPLKGAELAVLPTIDHAWLHLEGDRIAAFGPMSALPADLSLLQDTDDGFDCSGRL